MTDLAAWLRACIAEDEADAQAAAAKTDGPVPWDEKPERWSAGEDVHTAVYGRYVAVGPWGCPVGEAVARHIARWDPARVLAEVAAKRAVLDLHEIEVEKTRTPRFDEWTGQPLPEEFEVTCSVCGWVGDLPGMACRTISALAEPLTDRPGFDPAWRLP